MSKPNIAIVDTGSGNLRSVEKALALAGADPFVTQEQFGSMGRKVELPQLLKESDFVSIHIPLTEETRYAMTYRELSQMKPTAFIINTARGPILEEAGLVRALKERKIAGAGLDVYENEPHVSPELTAMSNVVLTPHLGSAVTQLREIMANVVADNIFAILEDRRAPNCWNTEIYDAKS